MFLDQSIASVRNELQMYRNALTTSHCHLTAKYECCVSLGSVETFTTYCTDIIHVRWKTFVFLYVELTQDNMYKIYQNRSVL